MIPVTKVYTLLVKPDLSAMMQAYELAKAALSISEGEHLLALHDAIVNCLTTFLSEIAEHHLQNQALWGIRVNEVDIQSMVDESNFSWKESQKLRANGFDSTKLIEPYVKGQMFPLGSSDWRNQINLVLRHQNDPKWIERLGSILLNENRPD